jgi:hypothetical protein
MVVKKLNVTVPANGGTSPVAGVNTATSYMLVPTGREFPFGTTAPPDAL